MEMTFLEVLVVTPFVALLLWALADVLGTPRPHWVETKQSQVGNSPAVSSRGVAMGGNPPA